MIIDDTPWSLNGFTHIQPDEWLEELGWAKMCYRMDYVSYDVGTLAKTRLATALIIRRMIKSGLSKQTP